MKGQDFTIEHDCMPGPFDYLGHVFLRNCQKMISENVTRPAADIYYNVKNAIYEAMGVDGSDLSPELQLKKKDVMLALAPFNCLHSTLVRERRKYIPADLDTMEEFDQNHEWNFNKEENLCKFAGKKT